MIFLVCDPPEGGQCPGWVARCQRYSICVILGTPDKRSCGLSAQTGGSVTGGHKDKVLCAKLYVPFLLHIGSCVSEFRSGTLYPKAPLSGVSHNPRVVQQACNNILSRNLFKKLVTIFRLLVTPFGDSVTLFRDQVTICRKL